MAHPPADPARPHVRLRRSPAWLVAGVLAICLGGLASAFLYLSASATQPVLVLTSTVYRGQVIERDKLAVVSAPQAWDVRVVPESRAGEVVGQVAATDLPGGSLLVEGGWTDTAQPAGASRVGVRLEQGQFPAGDLRPGTPLLVVAIPDPAVPDPERQVPASVRATLVGTPTTQPDGAVTVDVFVDAAQAERVARLAALKRVVLVQEPAR